jgi:hypothetical protein
MKEFFILFLALGLWSCETQKVQKSPAQPKEVSSYIIRLNRSTSVYDTFAAADYPLNRLQAALDSLAKKSNSKDLKHQVVNVINLVNEIEMRPEPLIMDDYGVRSRLNLLRTYLLQFKGALEDQEAVEATFDLVNEANNALLVYWNALVN